jgi:hypothetical protein
MCAAIVTFLTAGGTPARAPAPAVLPITWSLMVSMSGCTPPHATQTTTNRALSVSYRQAFALFAPRMHGMYLCPKAPNEVLQLCVCNNVRQTRLASSQKSIQLGPQLQPTPPPHTAAPVQTKKPIPISVPVPVQWQGLAGPPALTCSSVATAPWVSMGSKGKVKSEKACGSTHDPRGIHTTTTAPTKAARRGDHRRACSAMTQRVRSRSSGVCCLPFTHHSWWPSERTTAGKSKLL